MGELNKELLPKHIAIIMDGNRRWAKDNGLTTKDGHSEGANNLERMVYFCNDIGIKYMTVYAFSTENWKRSKEEVHALMIILKNWMNKLLERTNSSNVKIRVIGEKENIPNDVQKSIEKLVEKTKNNTGMVLNIAFNYGGRAEIVHAVKEIANMIKHNKIDIEDINEQLVSDSIYTADQPDPDLMIRTSYELRTSNFLPWQLAYSEFYFTKKHWPEFDQNDMIIAIKEYQLRNRRFGGNS